MLEQQKQDYTYLFTYHTLFLEFLATFVLVIYFNLTIDTN